MRAGYPTFFTDTNVNFAKMLITLVSFVNCSIMAFQAYCIYPEKKLKISTI